MEQLAPGLRRWTSWHDHWEEDVGSVAVETDEGLVLIDPNDPPAELGKPAHVLLTVYWHARGTKELGAPRVWSASRSATPLRNRGIEVTDLVGGRGGATGRDQGVPDRARSRGRVLAA